MPIPSRFGHAYRIPCRQKPSHRWRAFECLEERALLAGSPAGLGEAAEWSASSLAADTSSLVAQDTAATPLIAVGQHGLLPNTPGQTIGIFVSGGRLVEGVNFNIQVADGGPELGGSQDGPAITGVDLINGTIFDNNNTGENDLLAMLGLEYPQAAAHTTTTLSGSVAASGLLATVTIDTTGFATGTWSLRMANTFNGPTDFAGIAASITDGSISVGNAPSANDLKLVLDEGTTYAGILTATDPDPGTSLEYRIVSGPSHGSLVDFNAATGAFTYQPFAGYSGSDEMVFVANDGSQDSAPATVTFEVAEVLGGVDWRGWTISSLQDDELWYSFQASRLGRLSVIASNITVGLELYDADQQLLASSSIVEGQQRIDASAISGETYRIRVHGTASNAELKIANLLVQNGASVTVYGTAQDDQLLFDASAGSAMVINGVGYQFSAAEASTFVFDGSGGSDHVHFLGSSGTDTATLYPNRGTFAGSGYSLSVAQVESFDYDGGAGDTVTIWGSRQTETYMAEPGRGWMTGDDVSIDVTAEMIYARGYGGGDTVVFSDSDGDDVLEYFSTWARMRGEGYFHHVRGFNTMRANAELGENGTDRVVIRGTRLNDYLKVNPYNADGQTVARFLSGSGSIWHIATGFDTIVGYGRGGGIIDQLVLNDTPAADTFELGRQEADLLEVADYGVSVTTYGFGTVELRRTNANGSADRVNLGDSQRPDHDDTLVGDPHQVTMTGPGYSNLVVDFPLVMAYSSGNGYDTAWFSDLDNPNDSRAGVDTFTGRPLFSQMEGPGYKLYARLFDEVHAESKYGQDIANLYGNANTDELTATATEVRLSGTHSNGAYANFTQSFHEINAYGGDGEDRALLTDATVDLATFGPPPGIALEELTQILWLNDFQSLELHQTATGQTTATAAVDQVFAYWP